MFTDKKYHTKTLQMSTHNMISWRNKQNIYLYIYLIWSYKRL